MQSILRTQSHRWRSEKTAVQAPCNNHITKIAISWERNKCLCQIQWQVLISCSNALEQIFLQKFKGKLYIFQNRMYLFKTDCRHGREKIHLLSIQTQLGLLRTVLSPSRNGGFVIWLGGRGVGVFWLVFLLFVCGVFLRICFMRCKT